MWEFLKIRVCKFEEFVKYVKKKLNTLPTSTQLNTALINSNRQMVRTTGGDLVIVVFNDPEDITDFTVLELDGSPYEGTFD